MQSVNKRIRYRVIELKSRLQDIAGTVFLKVDSGNDLPDVVSVSECVFRDHHALIVPGELVRVQVLLAHFQGVPKFRYSLQRIS